MHTLLQNPYLSVLIEETHDLLRFQRHKTRFPSLEEAEALFVEAMRVSQELPHAPRNLLMDFRDAPLRNDRAFEDLMSKLSPKIDAFRRRFTRDATLIRSAVGLLQLQRLRREKGREVGRLFQDEALALAYLSQPYNALEETG